jgi:hypothetical protein
LIGRSLNHYRITASIDADGMGEVFESMADVDEFKASSKGA